MRLSIDPGQNIFNPFICIVITVKEPDDYTVRVLITGKGICFICIYMHGQTVIPAYTYNHIRIDQCPSVAFSKHEYFIIILDFQCYCV